MSESSENEQPSDSEHSEPEVENDSNEKEPSWEDLVRLSSF